MSTYQGRALEREVRRKPAGGGRPLRQLLRVLAVMAVMTALAMAPWRALRHRFAVLTSIRVSGLRYLDAARIRHDARLSEGQDLISVDLDRVRQLVMMDPRIERADAWRNGLRGLEIRVTERVPALAVEHGETWEIDSTGVLLEPLQRGVVADVPLLSGADFSKYRPGTQIRTPMVQRGLAWAAILSDNALRLNGQVSEVDVSESRTTRLVLMNGIRVIGPAWPVTVRQLSGLRATLADLERKGVTPGEVDVRIPDQIIVRDAQPAVVATAEQPHTTS